SVAILTTLFLGTFIIGTGIAICNVLLPSIIKDNVPLKIAFMTGLYSTAMGVFAALASGLSYPSTTVLNINWQSFLLLSAIPAIMAYPICMYLSRKKFL